MSENIKHAVAIKSALAEFDYDSDIDISEYVSQVKASEDYQIFFQSQEPGGKQSPGFVSPSQGSSDNNLEQRVKAGDREAQRALFQKLMGG